MAYDTSVSVVVTHGVQTIKHPCWRYHLADDNRNHKFTLEKLGTSCMCFKYKYTYSTMQIHTTARHATLRVNCL